MQHKSVCGTAKWLLAVISQSHNRMYPRRRVLRIAPGVTPQNSASLLRQFRWECSVHADEPIANELLYHETVHFLMMKAGGTQGRTFSQELDTTGAKNILI